MWEAVILLVKLYPVQAMICGWLGRVLKGVMWAKESLLIEPGEGNSSFQGRQKTARAEELPGCGVLSTETGTVQGTRGRAGRHFSGTTLLCSVSHRSQRPSLSGL